MEILNKQEEDGKGRTSGERAWGEGKAVQGLR